MNDTGFEYNLRRQIESSTARRRKASRVLAILDDPPSRKRTRRLARMERVTAGAIGLSGKIDWSKVDWAALFDTLLKVLLALLPLLFMEDER